MLAYYSYLLLNFSLNYWVFIFVFFLTGIISNPSESGILQWLGTILSYIFNGFWVLPVFWISKPINSIWFQVKWAIIDFNPSHIYSTISKKGSVFFLFYVVFFLFFFFAVGRTLLWLLFKRPRSRQKGKPSEYISRILSLWLCITKINVNADGSHDLVFRNQLSDCI